MPSQKIKLKKSKKNHVIQNFHECGLLLKMAETEIGYLKELIKSKDDKINILKEIIKLKR